MEFFEDLWEDNPNYALYLMAEFEDDVVFQNTGDPEVDEIERRLAAGEDPDVVLADWGEGLGDKEDTEEPQKTLEEVVAENAPHTRAERTVEAEEEEFDDNYFDEEELEDAAEQ